MRSLTSILFIIVILASPFGEARSIPDPNQKPAPGNNEKQIPIQLAGYSAAVNYQLQCEGCHLPKGEGIPKGDVPRMKGFVGNFLKVEGGRKFLIQVPGASLSALNNKQLAELINWMLQDDSIADGSAPKNFMPYTEQEVASYRHIIIKDLAGTRKLIIEKIKNLNIDIPDGVIP